MLTPAIIRWAAVGYALLFVGAALAKLDNWRSWSITVSKFAALGGSWNKLIRFGAPSAESAVAAVAIRDPRAGLVASFLLLALFAVAVAILYRRHAGEECNCFGALLPSAISMNLVYRNSALAGGALALWWAVTRTDVEPLGALEILVACLFAIIAVVALELRRFRMHAHARLHDIPA